MLLRAVVDTSGMEGMHRQHKQTFRFQKDILSTLTHSPRQIQYFIRNFSKSISGIYLCWDISIICLLEYYRINNYAPKSHIYQLFYWRNSEKRRNNKMFQLYSNGIVVRINLNLPHNMNLLRSSCPRSCHHTLFELRTNSNAIMVNRHDIVHIQTANR